MCNRLKILHGNFHNYSGKWQCKILLETLPPAYRQPLPINPSCMPSVYPVILSRTEEQGR